MARPPSPRRGGRPRLTQGRYDGPIFTYQLDVQVKAPNAKEARRRAEAIAVELVAGGPLDATDLWVRVCTVQPDDPGRSNARRKQHDTAA